MNFFRPAVAEMVVPVEVVFPKTVNVPVWEIVVVSVIARVCKVTSPTPLQVILPMLVVPAPVKSSVPVTVNAPPKVTGTAPVEDKVIPVGIAVAARVIRFP